MDDGGWTEEKVHLEHQESINDEPHQYIPRSLAGIPLASHNPEFSENKNMSNNVLSHHVTTEAVHQHWANVAYLQIFRDVVTRIDGTGDTEAKATAAISLLLAIS